MFNTIARMTALIVLVTVAMPFDAIADKRTLIRFYKTINDEGQERALMMIKNDDEPGCQTVHSLRKASRVAVMGFEYCEIYAEPECAAETRIHPLWAKKKNKTEKLIDRAKNGRMTQGTRWMLGSGDNVGFRSFRCERTP